jgi:hypothetical protein
MKKALMQCQTENDFRQRCPNAAVFHIDISFGSMGYYVCEHCLPEWEQEFPALKITRNGQRVMSRWERERAIREEQKAAKTRKAVMIFILILAGIAAYLIS